MKFPNTDIEYVTLDDDSQVYLTDRLSELESSPSGGCSPYFRRVRQTKMFGVTATVDEPWIDDLMEDDLRAIFNTLRTHEEKQAKARAILGEAWERNWSEKLLREAIEQAFAALEGETQ